MKFDGKVIEKMRDLPRIVAETDIGAKVDVDLFRQGSSKTLTITLGELEKAELVGLIGEKKSSEILKESFVSLGFSVQALTPQLAEEMGFERRKLALLSPKWCRAVRRPTKISRLEIFYDGLVSALLKAWVNLPKTLRMLKRVAALEF